MSGVSGWDWKSLGAMIRERRDELGMSKYSVQRLGGPSAKLLTELERGEPQHTPRPATYSGLDRSLCWVPGTTAAILAGKPLPPQRQPPAERPRWAPGVPQRRPSTPVVEQEQHVAALVAENERLRRDRAHDGEVIDSQREELRRLRQRERGRPVPTVSTRREITREITREVREQVREQVLAEAREARKHDNLTLIPDPRSGWPYPVRVGYSGQHRRLTYALAVARILVREAENGSGTAAPTELVDQTLDQRQERQQSTHAQSS
jgi:hypothetical protein